MNENQAVTVQTDDDIILARIYVRRLAREAGLAMPDQARIALVTASLARTLELGKKRQGQIAVDRLNDGKRTGVRVVFTMVNGANCGLGHRAFETERPMVDELAVEKLPGNNVRITLIKWAA